MPEDELHGGKKEVGQQQRIRASRFRNEAPSGVRIVFCFTMLFKTRITTSFIRSQSSLNPPGTIGTDCEPFASRAGWLTFAFPQLCTFRELSLQPERTIGVLRWISVTRSNSHSFDEFTVRGKAIS